MAAAELGGGFGGLLGAWAGTARAAAMMRRVRAGQNVVAGRAGGAYARGVRERKFLSFIWAGDPTHTERERGWRVTRALAGTLRDVLEDWCGR
jgi:hypothetical protein